MRILPFVVVVLCLSMMNPSPIASAETPGLVAEYRVMDPLWDKPVDGSLVLTVVGPAPDGMVEWQMDIGDTVGADPAKVQEIIQAATGAFSIRAISERLPMTSPDGVGKITRYLLRDHRGKVTEYRHALTGEILLPRYQFKQNLLPWMTGTSRMEQGFAANGEYLGQAVLLSKVRQDDLPPTWNVDFDLHLNPELMVGMWWCGKDDGTGKDAQGEYRYVEYTEDDWRTMMEAGCNDLSAYPKARDLLQDKPVFFRTDNPRFPEDLYRSNYSYGWNYMMFVDEPAIHHIGRYPADAGLYHPGQLADLLIAMNKAAFGPNGMPSTIQQALIKNHHLGWLNLRTDGLPVWETEFQTAWYQMAGGAEGIVHEGRYSLDNGRWRIERLFGSPVEMTPEEYLRCHYAFMRGAARAFNRSWGTAIYGQCAPEFRTVALTVAYDMGAKWFWFWTGDHDHHLPQAEKVRIAREFQVYVKEHPRQSPAALLNSAKTAIVFPWGYTFATDHLWHYAGLNIKRKNAEGVSYRDVIAAAMWEGILCARRSEDFDFVIESPLVEQMDYEKVIRVNERGEVNVKSRHKAVRAPRPKIQLSVENAETLRLAPLPVLTPVFKCAPLLKEDTPFGPWTPLPGDQFTASGDWKGPEDLSGRIAFGYDGTYLHLRAEITDDIHCNNRPEWQIWDGDAIQVALDTRNVRNAEGFVSGQYELTIAMGSDGKVRTWRRPGSDDPEEEGPIEGVRTDVRRDEPAHRTIYTVAIPLSQIGGLIPVAQRSIGIGVVLADSDGLPDDPQFSSRKAWIETSPGSMVEKKRPERFGTLEFVPLESPEKPDWSWIALHPPETTVIPENGTVRFPLGAFSTSPGGMELNIECTLESLSPLPESRRTAALKCSIDNRWHVLGIRSDGPAGRYRMHVIVKDSQGREKTAISRDIFVYPVR